MGTPRPFRASVYLPGHDESGHSILVRKLSATTERRLSEACDRWESEGYAITRYEVLALPLEET